MNGAECGACGEIKCICEEVSREKGKALKSFEEDTNELYRVLVKPKGLRQRLLKWLYPELRKVADSLRECYWSN